MTSNGVAFSLGNKRPAAKVSIHDDDTKRQRRELVTGVAADGNIQLAQPTKDDPTGPRVIAKQTDTFQSGGGRATNRAPRFLPTAAAAEDLENAADKFETAAPEEARQVTYGLNRMHTSGHGDAAANGTSNGVHGGNITTANSREADTARFREDLKALPEDPSLDAYERMPVEDFGMALLRGMGWNEGQGVGRKKEVVKPVEYVKRPHRLGLGATPAPPPTSDKKHIKPGETRDAPKDLVYVDSQGQHKSIKTIDDKLIERRKEGAVVGKRMVVVDGRHHGCQCVVVAIQPKEEGRSERATVRLLPSEQTVTVRVKELSDTLPEETSPHKHTSRSKHKHHDKHNSSGRGVGGGHDNTTHYNDYCDSDTKTKKATHHHHHHHHPHRGESTRAHHDDDTHKTHASTHHIHDNGPSSAPTSTSKSTAAAAATHGHAATITYGHSATQSRSVKPWLLPHIRVRVVDKHVRKGRLYLKKGVVVDVAQPTVCDVVMDDNKEVITSLHQEQLETVVPRREGSRVMIVGGALRHRAATLLKKNNDTGLAAVQLLDELSVEKLSLDDIAEFVGDDE